MVERIGQAENVRAASLVVSRGETPGLGIVYRRTPPLSRAS
jgi:hypothetical protein